MCDRACVPVCMCACVRACACARACVGVIVLMVRECVCVLLLRVLRHICVSAMQVSHSVILATTSPMKHIKSYPVLVRNCVLFYVALFAFFDFNLTSA